MKITGEDIKRLRLPIASAAVLIALGAACLVWSETQLAEAKKAREAAKAQRTQAQKRVEQVAEEEREIRENLIYYQKMVDRGMVGQENRLDLIDSIAKIKNDRKLFEIKYVIDPQKPLDYAGIQPAGPTDFVASRIKLDMMLLHEEDLLNFLSDLDRVGRSHVAVRHCLVTRLDRGPATQVTVAPRLRSECEVDMVVLKQVAAG